MPADHYIKTCAGWMQIHRIHIVNHINCFARKLNHFSFRELTRPRLHIHIAANRRYWRNFPELDNNLRRPEIACVKDMFRPVQCLDRLTPKQAVGVRDDSNNHSQVFSVPPCLRGEKWFWCYSPASIRDRGSIKSRNASPMKLNDNTASITARAGKITRCGASNRCDRPSFSIE